MAKRTVVLWMIVLMMISGCAIWVAAQDREQESGNSVIRVVVAMVQLNVAVIDAKGNYVTNLHPSDFVVSEDGIGQKIATFEEGNEGPQNLLEASQPAAAPKGQPTDPAPGGGAQSGSLEGIASTVNGANVFIL